MGTDRLKIISRQNILHIIINLFFIWTKSTGKNLYTGWQFSQAIEISMLIFHAAIGSVPKEVRCWNFAWSCKSLCDQRTTHVSFKCHQNRLVNSKVIVIYDDNDSNLTPKITRLDSIFFNKVCLEVWPTLVLNITKIG